MTYDGRNITITPKYGDTGTYNISVYLTDNGQPPLTTEYYFILNILKDLVLP